MRNSPTSRPRWRRSRQPSPPLPALPILATCAALSLLTACGVRDRVIIQPVAPPPVSEQLTAPLSVPRCSPKVADVYAPEALEAERKCLAQAERRARDRHTALASAVTVREAAVTEMIKGTR